MNKELKFGTDLHTKILTALQNRINNGAIAVSKKTSDYAKEEERFRAYIPAKEADRLRKVERESGEPKYTTIEVPYSFAMLMAHHTYLCSVFLSRSPIFQFQGRHGQAEQQVQAVEAIMDYQVLVGEMLVPFFLWLLDCPKYGVGITGEYWDEEFTVVSAIEDVPDKYLGVETGTFTKKRVTRRIPGYKGNKVFNVRPQDFIFDSRVSLANFQQGEFCGRYTDLSWSTIIDRKMRGQYSNIDALKEKHKNANTSANAHVGERDLGSSQLELPSAVSGSDLGSQDNDFLTPGFTNAVELTVKLIPKDWGLGASEYPENWNFTIADKDIIIESAPAPNYHGKFPYNVIEYELEGYALQKRSMFEMLDPLNNAMTWLLNSHFYNVRSILNGQFVIDPSRLVMKDFKSDVGGRIIRAKPSAYGTDLRNAAFQLQTVDVTQNHLRDMSVVGDLMQRVSGVTDNIMGMLNAGGRKTATEVRTSNAFGANRLKIAAEFNSAQGFAPLAAKMLANTQQFYDGNEKFRIAGDLMLEGNAFAEVTPEVIAGAFDFVPVDGSQPIDRFAQVTMWTQLMGQIQRMPQVMMSYDMGRIFAWIAQLGGLKNIHRFKLNVVPDDVALANAGAGKTLPIGGSNGTSGPGRGTSQKSGNATGVAGAVQTPGVGVAG